MSVNPAVVSRKPAMRTDRARLRDLIESLCLIVSEKPIKLSTGTFTHYYLDCKNVTLDGEGLSLTADAFLEEIQQLSKRPVAIGGLTMGADFITAAVIMRSHERGLPVVTGSIVRKEPKKHGTMNRIEKELKKGTPIVVVDDVITTGKSTRQACEEFRASGYNIVGIIALIDREEGGRAALERDFGEVRVIFTKSDFPKALKADEFVRAAGKPNTRVA